jgi:hypothetical protein
MSPAWTMTSAPVVRQAAIVPSIARTELGVADQADAQLRHAAIVLTRCTSVTVTSNNSGAQLRRPRSHQPIVLR